MCSEEAELQRGWKFLNEGKEGWSDNASAAFDLALKINPRSAEARFGKGNTYRELRQLNLAIVEYLKAVRLNPSHGEAYYWLGVCYEGRADFSKRFGHDPEETARNAKLAIKCYQRAKRFLEANQEFLAANYPYLRNGKAEQELQAIFMYVPPAQVVIKSTGKWSPPSQQIESLSKGSDAFSQESIESSLCLIRAKMRLIDSLVLDDLREVFRKIERASAKSIWIEPAYESFEFDFISAFAMRLEDTRSC